MYGYGGDFGEFPHDGNFCMDGLTYPDRTPHNGLLEYKNAIRPLQARWEAGGLVIRNCLDFTELSACIGAKYTVLSPQGEALSAGELPLPVIPPREERSVDFPGHLPQGCSLLVTSYTKKSTPLVPAGHETGFDQLFPYGEPPCPDFPSPVPGEISLTEKGNEFVISGKDFRYVFNRKTGLFDALTSRNLPYLARPMEWNLWRAPTDNDRYLADTWRAAGFDRITVRVYESQGACSDDTAVIRCRLALSAVYLQRIMDIEACWRIDAAGHVEGEFHCVRNGDFTFAPEGKPELVPLPRFGLRLFLPETFGQVDYLGWGPMESYSDKHLASYLGRFTSRVEDQHEDYSKPQENGSHFGTRWAAVESGFASLRASSDQPFSFSVSPFTQEELTAKTHNYQLETSGYTVLCLDYKQNGIGSNSCGPITEKPYRFEEPEFTFCLALDMSAKA